MLVPLIVFTNCLIVQKILEFVRKILKEWGGSAIITFKETGHNNERERERDTPTRL